MFATIKALVEEPLAAVETEIKTIACSPIPLLNEVLLHIIQSGGKRIRPLLLILVAKNLNANTPLMAATAAVIELLHTATLLHDDVIDATTERRGKITANCKFGSKEAILAGDFLYSRTFNTLINLNNNAIMQSLAQSATLMAEGEMQQLSYKSSLNVSAELYFEFIYAKTAALFASTVEIAALVSPSAQLTLENYQQLGANIGMVFQLIDDALDYEVQNNLGKDQGQDLWEKKTTLPLIFTLAQSTAAERAIIEKYYQEPAPNALEHFAILQLVASKGAIEYTKKVATQYAEKAKAIAYQLPDNCFKQGILSLIDFLLIRNF